MSHSICGTTAFIGLRVIERDVWNDARLVVPPLYPVNESEDAKG